MLNQKTRINTIGLCEVNSEQHHEQGSDFTSLMKIELNFDVRGQSPQIK